MPKEHDLALVTCSIGLRFPKRGADSGVQLLLSTVGQTQAKTGCVSCAVARDAMEPECVRYTEEWSSDPAFRRHLRSEEFRRVLAAMDMCCEEPQVVIGNLSGRSGIAYLQELRETASS
jgi:quinol monooxygenase YgiN